MGNNYLVHALDLNRVDLLCLFKIGKVEFIKCTYNSLFDFWIRSFDSSVGRK